MQQGRDATLRMQFYTNKCNEGKTLTPNPNECNSTLTNGTNNIYPYPYIDVNDQGHHFRSGSPLTNNPHAMATSSLPLNFTSLLPLIYRGSTVVLPWHKGNLKYGWLIRLDKKRRQQSLLSSERKLKSNLIKCKRFELNITI